MDMAIRYAAVRPMEVFKYVRPNLYTAPIPKRPSNNAGALALISFSPKTVIEILQKMEYRI